MSDEPDGEERRLADHLRVAEVRERHERDDAEADRAEREQQVDAQHRARRQHRRGVAALLGRLDRRRVHQWSWLCPGRKAFGSPNHSESISRAAGAAAAAPKPPCSIVTARTIDLVPSGT